LIALALILTLAATLSGGFDCLPRRRGRCLHHHQQHSDYRQTFLHDAKNVSQISVLATASNESIAGMEFLRNLPKKIAEHAALTFLLVLCGGDVAITLMATFIVRALSKWFGASALPPHFYLVLALLIFCALTLVAMLASVSYRIMPNVPRDRLGLHIHYAKWSYGRLPWQSKDRTIAVRLWIHSNSVEMPITTSTLGEPKFGVPKRLTVSYSFAGFTRTISIREGIPDAPSQLSLPESELLEALEKMLKQYPVNKT
jgi:hypothetical protein